MTITTTYFNHHFLIAMPNLMDPHFHQSVTYICMHTEEGAMGIVINRPLNLKLGEILLHMELDTHDPTVEDQPVYDGGPVQREHGFVLHRPEQGDWDAMFNHNNDICVTTSRDILVSIAEGNGPQDTLVALGYAGWQAGQLEQEVAENAWLSIPADADLLFNTPIEQRWQAAASRLGVDLSLISNQAGHA